MSKKPSKISSFIEESLKMAPNLKMQPPPKKVEPRILTPRKMKGEHEKEEFAQPFDSTVPGYANSLPMIADVPVGDFPNNIQRWVWSSPGENDGESWEAIFEILNDEEGGRFVQQHAWCDQTGFDCQGGIDVIAARDIPTLIEQAMGNAAQERYIKTTEPAEEW